MKGIDAMLKPALQLLEVMVPDAEPENDASVFMAELVEDYVPSDLPKDLIRKFIVDAVNKNPDKFDELLRELYIRILGYFNQKQV